MPPRLLLGRHLGDQVEGAAELVGPHDLQVLTLQPHLGAGAGAEAFVRFEGRAAHDRLEPVLGAARRPPRSAGARSVLTSGGTAVVDIASNATGSSSPSDRISAAPRRAIRGPGPVRSRPAGRLVPMTMDSPPPDDARNAGAAGGRTRRSVGRSWPSPCWWPCWAWGRSQPRCWARTTSPRPPAGAQPRSPPASRRAPAVQRPAGPRRTILGGPGVTNPDGTPAAGSGGGAAGAGGGSGGAGGRSGRHRGHGRRRNGRRRHRFGHPARRGNGRGNGGNGGGGSGGGGSTGTQPGGGQSTTPTTASSTPTTREGEDYRCPALRSVMGLDPQLVELARQIGCI